MATWSRLVGAVGLALLLAAAATLTVKAKTGSPRRASSSVGANLATAPPNPVPQPAEMPVWWHSVVTLYHRLPYTTVVHADPSLPMGIVRLAEAGADGEAAIQVYNLYQGASLISSTVLSERTIVPPRPEVVLRGAMEPSRGSLTGPVTGTLTVLASGYWADPAWSDGVTATGVRAHYGSVAVDPTVIPFGTRLYIPGYGYGVADDTGGAIHGDRIDLYFPSESEALDWGLRTVTVSILGR